MDELRHPTPSIDPCTISTTRQPNGRDPWSEPQGESLEILRLREENAELRKSLGEIGRLLDLKGGPRSTGYPRLFPIVGLL